MQRLFMIGVLAALLASCGSTPDATPPSATSVAQQPTADAPSATSIVIDPTAAIQETPAAEPTAAPAGPTPAPAPVFAPPAPFDDATKPDRALGSLYNALNRAEFDRAYAYFENPAQDQTTFTAGYASTQAVALLIDPNFRVDTGAGNQHATVRSAVVAYDTQRGWQLFAGCYTLHRVNINGPEESWYIDQASIAPVEAVGALPGALQAACVDQEPAATSATAYAMNTTDYGLLTTWANAVSRGEFARAAGYMAQPVEPETLANKYPAGAQVRLLINPDAPLGAAAGNVYRALPLVQIVTDQVGQPTLQSGCTLLHRPNVDPINQPWDIQKLASTPVTLDGPGLFAAATQPCEP